MSSALPRPASAAAATAPAAHTSDHEPIMTQRQIMLVIIGLMAGMFLSSLDQTIVGTAIRTIGDDLHGLDKQAWVTTAYLITSTIATPIYGKISDIFGRRPLYIFGIGVFILGSLLSSFSTSMLMLAAFRAVQGIGAGALMSLPLAIMGDILTPRERAKYQGYFLAVFGVSSVLGPLIGGLFAGANEILSIAGWRWVFLINVPIGLVALAIVMAFLHLPKVDDEKTKPRVDWWGATAVIVALVPLLLVAEQGREWGWDSAAAITCYVVGAVGLAAFILIEQRMGRDAIIPLSLFRLGAFSMSSVLGFLVGFAMFGAMMTIPLYLQIVLGLTPTESGFATLPMVLGLMIASILSGQIVMRTGKYGFLPKTGTFSTMIGYFILTFMGIDRPLWFLMLGMFFVGFGLGQLMQSLTLATQSAVEPRDMGVATSASTFFRQIGGTMGTAVLLSVLFSVMPHNISTAMGNRDDLKPALSAALDPSVAAAPDNQGVMEKIWSPIVDPVKEQVQEQLDKGVAQAKAAADKAVTEQVTKAVQAQVAAGAVPAEAAQTVIAQQVEKAKPGAEAKALEAVASKAHASVTDGKVQVDWSNDAQRNHWVDELTPKLADKINEEASKDGETKADTSASDTSYLNHADPRLTRPFMNGFNESARTIYWVGFGVITLAFLLSWFFKVPELRTTSGLQSRANTAREAQAATA
ncbi:EmrB/QacA subfamily drug resistance transporter [Falsarthrobacter nasiphocae]|uniref:EmrB/QacA subfamily drug resistance transporter n=2 Tax=Falsarthrobacter nasiphocae TaxID=189863 RepID=A0AAE3YFQ4_9MICC|nr:EmrB/QacA subfamily drug resistance transporter [Falsarthrobacter nasiphocae]